MPTKTIEPATPIFKLLPTDRRYRDREVGRLEICSRCAGQIPDESVPLMLFVNEGKDGMYVFCDYCTERVGFWSHNHYPRGPETAGEPLLCAECEYAIMPTDDGWKIAPPSPMREIEQ